MKHFLRLLLLSVISLLCATIVMAEGKPADSGKDIVDIASGSKDHSTLVAAIVKAELVDVLKNPGPFTVFAPTNAAFDKLPKGTLDNLLKPESKEALQNILQYHVAVGVFKEALLTDGRVINEANGDDVTIAAKGGKITVNGANIVGTVQGTNGIVHVIDTVLLPPEKNKS